MQSKKSLKNLNKTKKANDIIISSKESKVFEESLPGTDIMIPMQFFIPEKFSGRRSLIKKIQDQGGVVLDHMTPLTLQLICLRDITPSTPAK